MARDYYKHDNDWWEDLDAQKQETFKRMCQLRKEGHTYLEIAILLGYSERHISRLFKQLREEQEFYK